METFLMFLMAFVALLLIVLVLIQRGKGGGLAGAFGGMGGHSAFGTKAASRATWITYGLAAFWILTSAFTVTWVKGSGDPTAGANFGAKAGGGTSPTVPVTGDPPKSPGDTTPDKATEAGKPASETTEAGKTPPGEVTEKDFPPAGKAAEPKPEP